MIAQDDFLQAGYKTPSASLSNLYLDYFGLHCGVGESRRFMVQFRRVILMITLNEEQMTAFREFEKARDGLLETAASASDEDPAETTLVAAARWRKAYRSWVPAALETAEVVAIEQKYRESVTGF